MQVAGEPREFLAIASTGRTATSFIAEALNRVGGIAALHEGHLGNDAGPDVLPMVNLDNFQCFKSAERAAAVVGEKRNTEILAMARRSLGVHLLVDVAYYNAVLLDEILRQVPSACGAIVIRDCESFVRSATWFTGTDPMPVGWPDPAKELDARERFIGLGRLRPVAGPDLEVWSTWGAIERNIWLWRVTNSLLCDTWERWRDRVVFVDFTALVTDPKRVLCGVLDTIGFPLGPEQSAQFEGALVEARTRQNERLGGYQVGPAETWSDEQQGLLAGATSEISRRVETLSG